MDKAPKFVPSPGAQIFWIYSCLCFYRSFQALKKFNQVDQCEPYEDPGAFATDDIDSNAVVTANIVTTATAPLPIDTTAPGVVTIFYNVEDSFGNQAETKSRVVEVSLCVESKKWLKISSDLFIFIFKKRGAE